ncbi:MAG: hypothetical protein N2490_01230 [Ignavibacteria bacterium]|nr:hypothetical protein [Ignavibacteria bacterium]
MNKIEKQILFILISAVLFLLNSCEKKDSSIIDPCCRAPLISNFYKTKDTVFTTSFNPQINLNVSVNVDLNGGSPLKSVICRVLFPDNSLAGTFPLQDNGVSPDSISGDGRYSGTINISNISCLLVGQYTINVYAENTDGYISNQINSKFIVVNTQNFPPYITSLNLPDSVVRPVTGFINLTIEATANDTNGFCDIKTVQFDAYRPTGNYIGRFEMKKENNFGLFSFTAPVGASTADSLFGYFKYYFQAIDNSNAVSQIVKDSIKFVRPN